MIPLWVQQAFRFQEKVEYNKYVNEQYTDPTDKLLADLLFVKQINLI